MDNNGKEFFIDSLKELIDTYVKENNLDVVMHFPHSSLEVPKSFWEDVSISKSYFHRINLLMSDLHLLELFEDWEYEKVVAPYSRIYVDVEKYWDEEKEAMARFGMGAVYLKDVFGNPLHLRTPAFMEEAKRYYDDHQNKLSFACEGDKDVLILDMHSFNKKMANVSGDHPNLPEICVGVNEDGSSPKNLLDRVLEWAKNEGISWRVNYPYAGAMFPNRHKGKNKVFSIMFEFNKAWYL